MLWQGSGDAPEKELHIMIDLGSIPLVDNHCHAYHRPTAALDATAFRRLFSEAHAPRAAVDHVPHAVYYRWALKELGRVLGCPATERDVLERRAALSVPDFVALLLGEAGIACMLIDTGLGGADFLSLDEMRALTGCRIEHVLRLETLAQSLILRADYFEQFEALLDQELTDLRGRGIVSLKSIAAYRSGLQIARVAPDTAAAAFAQVRARALPHGRLRLTDKTLIDYVVMRGLERAAEQQVPVQFHTGYGDPDTDLRQGNPLHLRPLFEDPALETAPIVLLHESYPFTREAAYLAAVYPNAYLDISYSVPFLDYHELLSCTRQALGVAPWSKVLYSSDGFGIPEHGWLGALHGRRVLAVALQEKIAVGELDADEALAAGEAILRRNSLRVYRLQGEGDAP
jgi:predicted TIM-barrel fold metal-dependent hydrolase